MSEENKIVELNDEQLDKVTGGISTDANGNYVLNQYDRFRTPSENGSQNQTSYVVLQAISTKNLDDKVYCCRIQSATIPPTLSDEHVTISYLNTLTYTGNYYINPHEIYGY